MRDAQLERARHFAAIAPSKAVGGHCVQQGTEVQLATLKRKRVRLGRGSGPSEVLQPRRSLPLIRDPASETKERRCRVKQAADGSCCERAHFFAHEFGSAEVARRELEGRQGKIW